MRRGSRKRMEKTRKLGERGRTRKEPDMAAEGGEIFRKKTVTNITELTGKGEL